MTKLPPNYIPPHPSPAHSFYSPFSDSPSLHLLRRRCRLRRAAAAQPRTTTHAYLTSHPSLFTSSSRREAPSPSQHHLRNSPPPFADDQPASHLTPAVAATPSGLPTRVPASRPTPHNSDSI
ncbi:hypothetical protein DCAR_0414482 [Daucus carota subsp. sativus]|uniref:Uncharacterized protein n=1 Tax=Daucus carota subsp. sativus TaxID=79200 RepID=A0A175YC18_DAUCS|nr:hypothetical protein DCAR_0414482 [Daucus carota subsp. sativus]